MSVKEASILIPTYEPGGLDAKIYPHWKDAPTFTHIVLVNSGVKEVYIHRLSSDDLIINIVKREGVKYVIAQSLSTRAIELLKKLGVKVLLGNVKTVREAVEKFRDKELYVVKLHKIPQKNEEEKSS